MFDADLPASLADAQAALDKAERAGDPALLAMAIARLGTVETYAAQITPGILERGAEMEERRGLVLEYYASPRYTLSRLLIRLGEIERPRLILSDMERAAAARGDEGSRVMVLLDLGCSSGSPATGGERSTSLSPHMR